MIITLMPTIRRRNKYIRRDKTKPEVITGNFELHYEDVVGRNRFAVALLFATGLVLIAVFVPNVVDRSLARPDHVTVEAESGDVINPDQVKFKSDDIGASNGSYIEFNLKSQ